MENRRSILKVICVAPALAAPVVLAIAKESRPPLPRSIPNVRLIGADDWNLVMDRIEELERGK